VKKEIRAPDAVEELESISATKGPSKVHSKEDEPKDQLEQNEHFVHEHLKLGRYLFASVFAAPKLMLFFRVSKHRWHWKIALVDSGLEMRGKAWASGVQKFNLDGNSAILEKLVRDGELHKRDAKKDSAPNCVSNSTAPKLEKAQSGAQEEALSMERPAPILKKWFSTEVKNSPEEIT